MPLSIHPRWTARGYKACGKAAPGQGTLELIPTLIMFCMMLAVISALCLYLYLQNVTITVAREGARFASLNAELGTTATQQTGINAVKQKIISMVETAIGQDIDTNAIQVNTPAGTFGERLVSVRVNLDIPNPVALPDFSGDFSDTSGKLFETIPLSAEASAHYEE